MKKSNDDYSTNDNLLIFISLAISVLFLLIDGLSGLKAIRNATSYVIEPVTNQANIAGGAVKDYLNTFTQFEQLRSDYNNLKIKSYEEESKYSDYLVLLNENEALKQQLALGNKNAKYTLANVMRSDNVNTLSIDEGSESGIQVGDVVSYGNTFIGIVSRADLMGSTVRLPIDESSHFEVVIMKSDTQGGILSSGVASGSTNGIKIENITMNSSVADGDVVFINDTKVGGFLTLGYIVGLSESKSSTYKTAYVSPVLDYNSLMQVFVKID